MVVPVLVRQSQHRAPNPRILAGHTYGAWLVLSFAGTDLDNSLTDLVEGAVSSEHEHPGYPFDREVLHAGMGPCVVFMAPGDLSLAPSGFWLPPSLGPEDTESLNRAGRAYGQYAFFDLVDHVRTRDFGPAWMLFDAMQDAIRHTRAGHIGRIRVLRLPLAALPALQLVLEPAGIAPDWVVIPMDARAAVGVICTILNPHQAAGFAHAYTAGQTCPALPESFHRFIARGHWSLHRTDGGNARPFDAPVLDDDATLIVQTRCAGGHTSSLGSQPASSSLPSYSSASTSSVTDEWGRITPFNYIYRDDEHPTEMHVVFHAEGLRPWRHSFPRIATSQDLARHAAIRMRGATGQAAWRIAFLPRQPVVNSVHLHVMVLPAGEVTDALPFLLDSRRVFGSQLGNIQLLRTRPGGSGDMHGFVNAAEQALLQAGLAEVPFVFHVSAHRPAAVVVPAWEGLPAYVLEDTVHTIMQFPGLRQASLRSTAFSARETPRHVSTTTTTTFMQPDEPFHFVLPSPRRIVARLGIPTGTSNGQIFRTG